MSRPSRCQKLQADGFVRGWRGGLARQRRPDYAAVLVELHAQAEAHLHQYILDLVERFPAEVLGLQHFVFALLHELADGLDVGVLQAVVAAHGKLQLFDGAIQVFEPRIVDDILRHLDVLGRLVDVDEDNHVILHQLRGQADGVLRGDGAVGPDFDHQLFVIGHVSETCRFDRVIDLAHGRVNAVYRNVADGQVFVVVAVGGNVSAAVFDAHFDLQLAAFADSGDVHALVEHGEIRIFLDLGAGDHARLLNVQVNGLRQIVVQLDGHLLQVQDDVGRILNHTGDRRELVQHALDFHRGDSRALDGAEERATQCVSNRGAPTALKRLGRKTAIPFGQRFELRRETFRFLKSLPHRVPSFWPDTIGPNTLMPLCGGRSKDRPLHGSYFEYSSTISCSLIGGVCMSSRLGRATTLDLNCSRSCSSHGTEFWLCATLRASSTMAFWCILSLIATSSPTLT